MAFNENEEPRGLEIYNEIPGLRAEGEPGNVDAMQTTPETRITTPEPTIKLPDEITARQLRPREEILDYRKINNPQARKPSLRYTPSPSPGPIDVTRPTISSAAKSSERTNISLENSDIKIDFNDAAFVAKAGREGDEWLPKSVEEALASAEAAQWREAINDELKSLEKMETWRIEDLPDGREAVGCRWVFTRKKDEHGNIIKYKARLVAQ